MGLGSGERAQWGSARGDIGGGLYLKFDSSGNVFVEWSLRAQASAAGRTYGPYSESKTYIVKGGGIVEPTGGITLGQGLSADLGGVSTMSAGLANGTVEGMSDLSLSVGGDLGIVTGEVGLNLVEAYKATVQFGLGVGNGLVGMGRWAASLLDPSTSCGTASPDSCD